MTAEASRNPVGPIGLFDSGVGGLSVLRAMASAAPATPLIYVADSGHAPYGERDDAFVRQRSLRLAAFVREQGAASLVVACNTATAAAIDLLRETHPDWPIVGVEPGIKPAIAATGNRRIGVMATSATLRSARLQRLLLTHAAGATVHLQPCPGLADAIETRDPDDAALLALVDRYCSDLKAYDIDTLVLGCTHYALVADRIARAMGPGVRLIDTAEAVARQALTLAPAAPASVRPPVRLWTSGDVQTLRAVAGRWLDRPCSVQALPAGV